MNSDLKTIVNVIAKLENETDRTILFTGTDDTLDRDEDIITPDGWKTENYMKNPVFLWAHDSWSPPVGRAIELRQTEKGLDFLIQFPTAETYDFADTIFKLYKEKYLNAVSVGFRILQTKWQGETRYITEKELYELSGCPIPCNPNALQHESLVKARKSGLINETEFNRVLQKRPEVTVYKPYANEHACRLKSPADFESFVRKNCHIKSDGKCIDVIFGITGEKSEMQALRFDKDVWTEADARTYCDEKGGTFEPAKSLDISLPKAHNSISLYDETFQEAADKNANGSDENLIKETTETLKKFKHEKKNE